MSHWVPLSTMCVGGIVATPDKDGVFCWVVDGTQWKYHGRLGLVIEVFHGQGWKPVGSMASLNQAVAFSLGWRARNQFAASEPVVDLGAIGDGLPVQPHQVD